MREAVLAFVSSLCLASALAAESAEPRVPAGMDPGGVAVALIGGGVDYTASDIAARLARDGEGELIGWDFADDDRRPFAGGVDGNGTALARIVLAEAPSARLAVFRVAPAPGATLVRAAAYASQSPARIVLLPASGNGSEDLKPLRQAAAHFKDRLFIVPAGGAPVAGLSALENVLVVAAADAEGKPLAGAGAFAKDDIDVAAGIKAGGGNGAAAKAADSADIAAARIAALAARLASQDDRLTGPALKSRITSLASQTPSPGATRFGWIADPFAIASE